MPGTKKSYPPPAPKDIRGYRGRKVTPIPQVKRKKKKTITIHKVRPAPGYMVKSGDTLFSLARKWATTVNDIARLNKIKDPNKIRVGDRLRKPAFTRMPPAAKDPRTGKPLLK